MRTCVLRLTDLEALGRAAECLRTLAHPHRLRMVQMLLQADFTVSELADACHLPSAMASEHLRLMQRCGFLVSEREGRNVYYHVNDPHLKNILRCIEERFGVAAAKSRQDGDPKRQRGRKTAARRGSDAATP